MTYELLVDINFLRLEVLFHGRYLIALQVQFKSLKC